ncbi:unnamed protein product [Polarella glacialis]|uniref:AMP-dependent synthetase/ligase domain-containing protein n=1 Tax=Polarella glacialis TaxID=89957 RepID=A0A813LXA4_POLGL|nr:unnamed protein product [Polarella glacialis]
MACQTYASNACMGTRPVNLCTFEGKKQYWTKGPYSWKTYAEVHRDVVAAARGLLLLPGIKEMRDEKQAFRQVQECVVAILADTSADWQISSLAAMQVGLTITTVYTTLGHEAMLHGLNETQAKVLFVDWAQYDVLKESVMSKCPALLHIVAIGSAHIPLKTVGGETKAFPTPQEASALAAIGAAFTTTLEGLIAAGSADATDLGHYRPSEQDVVIIMYTSGSSGLPKGVVLSHLNFVSVMASILATGAIAPLATDKYIGYLPLAHIFELAVEATYLCQGSAIGYGHVSTLTSGSPRMHPKDPEGSDLLTLRPTFMAAVPAVLDSIKTGLNMKLSKIPGLKGELARGAVNKAQGLPSGAGCLASCLLDCLQAKLLHMVRSQLGLENLRIMISGGAPLSPETQEFVSAVIAPVAQGYGATETTGCASIQETVSCGGRPADQSFGHVGAIQPATEIKLRSVPDMGYNVTDSPPRGEILISGNNVSETGYYKLPEKSAEDFVRHSDGKIWFHTGDIGVVMETGVLKIIDRKKDLIKLTGGEYVSLGKVEAALKQVPGIGAVVVFALAGKDHCVAVVSQPDKGWEFVGGRPDETALLKSLSEKLTEMGLAPFEIPGKVKVDDTIWTPETGLVTASLKVQRNPLREHYNKPAGPLDQMAYRFPDL